MKILYKYIPLDIYHNFKRLNFYFNNKKAFKKLQHLRAVDTNDSYSCKPFEQTKSIFVHIPKCAGISVNKTLYGNLAGGHLTINDYLYMFSPKDLSSFFKFTIVRNPWDRLVSAFHFLKNGGFDDSDKKWALENLSSFDDFDSFVRVWLNKSNIWLFDHFRPQYHYFMEKNNKVQMDFIGYFENLEEDFEFISERIGKPSRLHKSNVSMRSDYKDYYNDATIKIVSEVYNRDIEILGYNFDNSSLADQLIKRNESLGLRI